VAPEPPFLFKIGKSNLKFAELWLLAGLRSIIISQRRAHDSPSSKRYVLTAFIGPSIVFQIMLKGPLVLLIIPLFFP